MELVGTVALLVGGFVSLWGGARWLVGGASRLAASVGISPLVVGLTVVAVGTSAPEIAVSTAAAFEDQGDVAVGNVVGSNVFNLAVILGLVAALSPFRVTATLVRRDALAMAGATCVGALVLRDFVVSRPEGALLLALLLAYLGAIGATIHRSGDDESIGADSADADPAASDSGGLETTERADARGRASVDPTDRLRHAADERVRAGRETARLLVGLVLVAVGGRLLVDSATTLALSVGVSAWLVGVTVVAAGTSLPELVTALVATRRGDVAIAAGNVVGSSVFNLLGVLGIAAAVRPLSVAPAVTAGLYWLLAVTAVATVLVATGRRVTRLEGIALVAVGATYWIATATG